MKRKENSFSLQGEEEGFFFENQCTKDWLRDHTSWVPCGIEMKAKGILKSWFWISLHQGTISILCSRIQGYMLSFINEVDPFLLLPLCVLYEIQNQIFQQLVLLFVFFFFFGGGGGLFMWGIMVNGYLFNYTLNGIYNDAHGYLMLSKLFCVDCVGFNCHG